MKKFIPYEKLSKKEKRERDRIKRKTWGSINPVTRKPENPKAYKRKKDQRSYDYDRDADFLFSLSSRSKDGRSR